MGVSTMSADERRKTDAHKDRKIDALLIYTACVSGLGVALLAWSLFHLAPAWPGILLFLILTIISEFTTGATIAPQMSFSISSSVNFAALLLYGPLPATLIATVGGLVSTAVRAVQDLLRGRARGAPFWQRALFNQAALGLPMAIGGGVYVLLGGTINQVARLSNALPALVAAACIEVWVSLNSWETLAPRVWFDETSRASDAHECANWRFL